MRSKGSHAVGRARASPPRFAQANNGGRVLGMLNTMCIILCRSWVRQWVAWCSLTGGTVSLLDGGRWGHGRFIAHHVGNWRCVLALTTSNDRDQCTHALPL